MNKDFWPGLAQARPWLCGALLCSAAAAELPPPGGVTARTGDRSMTLHWDAVPGAAQYRVDRAEDASGPFRQLPGSPVEIQSAADTGIENGRTYYYRVQALGRGGAGALSNPVAATPRAFQNDDAFLDYVQAAAFEFFWRETRPENGLIRDRSRRSSFSSIAAIGFGLTALGIGIDHGWISREQGAERTARTLRTLIDLPQGPEASGTGGHRGWFYHFLDMETGRRFRQVELSSIDTALLLAGALYAREYFQGDDETERGIRSMAAHLFSRADWRWMLNGGDTLSMGWHPETGFIEARWKGYNEASILYVLGLGAGADNRLEPAHWESWTRTYEWRASHGFSFIHFAPLFGHQYSACWIDFRNIQDRYTREKGITYFENSRRATLAQRQYCIENPGRFAGYGENVWGLTACDGPGRDGAFDYRARGAPPPENDDGTIAPTAAGGSIPFAPAECIRALRHIYDLYREKIWCGYGFRDAFNPGLDWWDPEVIGIDQSPILIMIENHRTGRVWEVMQRSEIIRTGLARAGFAPVR